MSGCFHYRRLFILPIRLIESRKCNTGCEWSLAEGLVHTKNTLVKSNVNWNRNITQLDRLRRKKKMNSHGRRRTYCCDLVDLGNDLLQSRCNPLFCFRNPCADVGVRVSKPQSFSAPSQTKAKSRLFVRVRKICHVTYLTRPTWKVFTSSTSNFLRLSIQARSYHLHEFPFKPIKLI